ncbi:hypothetical protein [Nocardia farcinica]
MPPRTRKPRTEPLPTEGVAEALTVLETPEQVIPPVVDDVGAVIPPELQFTTPDTDDGDAEVPDEDLLEFSVDGEILIAYKPSPEQWGVLMAMMSTASTMADRWQAMQTFSATVLESASHMYVQRRLLDRTDRFGVETFDKVLQGIIAAFSPTPNREQRRAAARRLR